MISEELYYDHYKDTFQQLVKYIKKRDNYTLALLGMIVISCFKITDPNLLSDSVSELIDSHLSGIKISWSYITVFVSYLFLWIILQYYQICLTIENTYDYLHEIENNISKTGEFSIIREGVKYKEHYPWLKNLSHIIYVFIIPLIIIVLTIAVAIDDFSLILVHKYVLSGILCLVANFLIFILTLLYISNRWLNEEVFSKKNFPNVKWHQRLYRYFIKK